MPGVYFTGDGCPPRRLMATTGLWDASTTCINVAGPSAQHGMEIDEPRVPW